MSAGVVLPALPTNTGVPRQYRVHGRYDRPESVPSKPVRCRRLRDRHWYPHILGTMDLLAPETQISRISRWVPSIIPISKRIISAGLSIGPRVTRSHDAEQRNIKQLAHQVGLGLPRPAPTRQLPDGARAQPLRHQPGSQRATEVGHSAALVLPASRNERDELKSPSSRWN